MHGPVLGVSSEAPPRMERMEFVTVLEFRRIPKIPSPVVVEYDRFEREAVTWENGIDADALTTRLVARTTERLARSRELLFLDTDSILFATLKLLNESKLILPS